jgi:hypothetical protein
MAKVIILQVHNNCAAIPKLAQDARPLWAIVDVHHVKVPEPSDQGLQPQPILIAANEGYSRRSRAKRPCVARLVRQWVKICGGSRKAEDRYLEFIG